MLSSAYSIDSPEPSYKEQLSGYRTGAEGEIPEKHSGENLFLINFFFLREFIMCFCLRINF